MRLIDGKHITEIKSMVGGLFGKLYEQTKAYHSAGAHIDSLKTVLNSNQLTSAEKSIRTAQLNEAQATKAGANTEIHTIKDKIMKIRGELKGLLKEVCKSIEVLKKDLMKIKKAREALRFYKESLVPLRKGRNDLKKLIKDINKALAYHQQQMLGFSVSSGKTRTIDDFVAGTKIDTKFNKLNNYGLSTTDKTLYILNAELPGKSVYLRATEYIPHLTPSGNQRHGNISDKIRLGGDYTQKGNYANQTVNLPVYLNQVLRRGYSSKYGVYSVQT